MEFSCQEYWSGLPCPPPGDRPDPGIEPRSPALQADSLPSESGKPVHTKDPAKATWQMAGLTRLGMGQWEAVGGG